MSSTLSQIAAGVAVTLLVTAVATTHPIREDAAPEDQVALTGLLVEAFGSFALVEVESGLRVPLADPGKMLTGLENARVLVVGSWKAGAAGDVFLVVSRVTPLSRASRRSPRLTIR